MSKPHLADVAREAGVSVGAASLALSGRGRISEATRQRVREAAARLGYAADPIARAMRGGVLPLVGLVITDLADPAEFEMWAAFWSQVMGTLSVAAARRKFGFVLLPALADTELTSVPLAGYALIGTDVPDAEVDAAVATGRPVLTDTLTTNPGVAVRIDVGYEASTLAALDHLHLMGATRPGLLGVGNDTGWGRAVTEGHRRWQERSGVDSPMGDLLSADHPGEEAVEHLLEQGVDAIVTVFTDPDAIVGTLARHGRTVGDDIMVVAVDEDFHGHFARQGITTVGIGLRDVIHRAVDRFVDLIEGDQTSSRLVSCAISVNPRRSSGPLVRGS